MEQVTIEEQQARFEKIEGVLERICNYEEHEVGSYTLSKDEIEIVKSALAFYRTATGINIGRQLKAKECGAPEGQYDLSSHSEQQIFRGCVNLMEYLVHHFQRWYDFHEGEGASYELDEEERFSFSLHNTEIVECLLLRGTGHGGGCSTRAKCRELGLDPWDEVTFEFEREEE